MIGFLLVTLLVYPASGRSKQSSGGQARAPRVISIRFGQASGMCDGYCWAQIEVKPGEAELVKKVWYEGPSAPKESPDLHVRMDISSKRWDELQRLASRDNLLAEPNTISRCPGCTDQPVEWIEVTFSDHTKKAARYNVGDGPVGIRDLVEKLNALMEKLHNELPPKYWRR